MTGPGSGRDSARFQRLSAWFERAIALAPDRRSSVLEEAAADDPTLRAELEELLAQHDLAQDDAEHGVLGEAFLEAGRELVDGLARDAHARGSGPATTAAFVPPERIGRFRVVGEIGRGGVGVVLRAIDEEIGRDVAIKVLHDRAASLDVLRRFVEEGRIGGQLQHPSILPIHEIGETDQGHPMIVMKLVVGETLHALLERRASVEEERARFLRIFEQLCEGVAFAHSRGVLHRDLKPANVMVGNFGEVQVMDWGLAKVRDAGGAAAAPRSTDGAGAPPVPEVTESERIRLGAGPPGSSRIERSVAGTILGTPSTMSPEQARGELERVDARSDVFSLGAILCKILAGKGPYGSGDTERILVRARRGEIPGVAELATHAAGDPMAVLAIECLAADPDDRPADAAAVAARVREHRQSVEERARRAEVSAAEQRVRAKGERRARRLITAIAALVVIGVLGGGAVVVRDQLERERRTSAQEQRLARALSAAQSARDAARAAGIRDLGEWRTARVAARNAEELLTPLIAPALRTEAERLIREIDERTRVSEIVRRLDRIHEGSSELDNSVFGTTTAGRYRSAFLEIFGEDWFEVSAETAADRVRSLDADLAIVRSIDLWARMIRQTTGTGTIEQRHLHEIADRLDPEPWRMRLRSTAIDPSIAAYQELVADPAFEEQPPYALYVLAIYLAYETPELEEVTEILARAQFFFPDDFTINYDLGWMYADPLQSLRFSTAAVHCSPDSPFAHTQLGENLLAAGYTTAGWRHLDRAAALAPRAPQVLAARARCFANEGRFAEAEVAYRACLELQDPESPAAISNIVGICRLFARQERYTEAIEFFDWGERLLLEHGYPVAEAEFWNNDGVARKLTGDLDGAIDRFRRALRADDSHWIHRKNLGHALQQRGDFDEARTWIRAAAEAAPQEPIALCHLAEIEAIHGDLEACVEAASRVIALDPSGTFIPRLLAALLGQGAPLEGALARSVLHAVTGVHSSGGPLHPETRDLFVRLWLRTPDENCAALARAFAEAAASEAGPPDPTRSWWLARVLEAQGDVGAAIEILEVAQIYAGEGTPIDARLDALRREVSPDLLTDGTVAAIFAGGDDDSDGDDARGDAERREIEEAFLALPRTPERERRATLITAFRRASDGDLEGAVAGLTAALDRGHASPIPHLHLHRWLLALDGDAGAERFARAIADRLPRTVLPVPASPSRPQELDPAALATGRGVHLAVSPFAHPDPRVQHGSTHWTLWEEGADPNRSPLLEAEVPGASTRLALPPGLLRPRRSYTWSAVLRSVSGLHSTTVEGRLRTGTYPFDVVPVPLEEHFDSDVILAPGETPTDSFDIEGHSFVVEGYDPAGQETVVEGLPADGVVGVHRLADPRGPNALRCGFGGRSSVTVEVPPDRYLALRFLVSGANGSSRVPVRIEHLDGSVTVATVHCPDWFDDPEPGHSLDGVTPVLDHLDRADAQGIRDRGDPALFEVIVVPGSSSPVLAVILDFESISLDGATTRFHLFSIAGIRALGD